MMTQKMGRPKSVNPKNYELRTRVDSETNEKINSFCEQEKITRSIFLRRAIDLILGKTKK